jgi:hypothetical protein
MKILLQRTPTIIFIFILTAIMTGCASIVSKTNYPLLINSDPKGADIRVTDRRGREVFTGKTPKTITVKSGAGYFTPAKYEVRLKMAGYEEKIIPVTFTINGWYFGNIFLGGALGMLVIDPATGAMWKIKDPVVDESLTPLPATGGTLKIISISEADETLKKNLVVIPS